MEPTEGDQPERQHGADNPTDPMHLLEMLRRGDRSGRGEAIADMQQQLGQFARRYLGRQEGQADLQADSIVQSVMGRVFAEGLDQFHDDEHLRAGLHQRVKHLILDRKKKNRPGAMPRGEEDDTIEATGAGPGPGTQVARHEEDALAEKRRRAFVDTCMATPLTERQRRLLAACLDGGSWSSVAETLEMSVGAAKKMMSDIRPKVLAHVFEPLRTRVDGRCWALIELHFVQRRSIETSSSALGLDVDTAQRLLKHEIETAIVDHIGGVGGLQLFERLLGYKRS